MFQVLLLAILLIGTTAWVVPLDSTTSSSFSAVSSPAGLISATPSYVQLLGGTSNQVSAYWYNTQQSLSAGFSTSYTWSWSSSTSSAGDGVSFVLHNNPSGTAFVGRYGCNWGFRAATGDPDPKAVGVGFEGYTSAGTLRYIFAVAGNQSSVGCLNQNTTSLWIAVNEFLATAAPNPGTYTVTISWDAVTQAFSASYATGGTTFATLGATVDLIGMIGTSTVWAGFTAATGGANATFQISQNWTWISPWPAATTAPVTTAPATTAPVTTAPVTTAPATTAPGTTLPATTSPATTVLTTLPATTPPPLPNYGDACSNLSFSQPGVTTNCTNGASIIVVTLPIFLNGSLTLSNQSTLVLQQPITLAGCLNASGELIVDSSAQTPTNFTAISTPCVTSPFTHVSANNPACGSTASQSVTSSGLTILITPDCGSTSKGLILGVTLGIVGAALVIAGLGFLAWHYFRHTWIFNSSADVSRI